MSARLTAPARASADFAPPAPRGGAIGASGGPLTTAARPTSPPPTMANEVRAGHPGADGRAGQSGPVSSPIKLGPAASSPPGRLLARHTTNIASTWLGLTGLTDADLLTTYRGARERARVLRGEVRRRGLQPD